MYEKKAMIDALKTIKSQSVKIGSLKSDLIKSEKLSNDRHKDLSDLNNGLSKINSKIAQLNKLRKTFPVSDSDLLDIILTDIVANKMPITMIIDKLVKSIEK